MLANSGPRSRLRPRGLALATAVATCFASPALAEAAPPFSELLLNAASAPRLLVAEAETRRAEGLARQAGARPNPTLSAVMENISGTGPYRNFAGGETTLQASLPLELGGRRSARIDAGAAGVAAAQARSRDAAAAYAYDLALAYATAEAAELRVDRGRDEVEEAAEDARAARALVAAGREASLRGLQSETALGVARAALEAAMAQREVAFARLTALAAFARPLTSIEHSLLDLKPATNRGPAFDPLDSPQYLSALAERNAIASQIRVEQSRAVPDVTASVGVRRFEQNGATALVAGVSLPFPVFDRNRGNIDAARAALMGAEARLEEARMNAEVDGRSAVRLLDAGQARLDAALASEGTAEEAYRLSRVGYESGKTSLLELISARRAVGEARSATIDARLARTTAMAALARLQGRPLSGDDQ